MRSQDLDSNFPLANQIEGVGRHAFPKHIGAGIEANIGGAANDQLEVGLVEAGEKRTLGNDAFKIFHESFPPEWRELLR